MRNSRLRLGLGIALLATGLVIGGCAVVRNTEPHNITEPAQNPFELAGAASASGPSGPRTGVPDASLTAENGDGGTIDKLALNTISDLQEYWNTEYAKNFPGSFTPVNHFISWDATAPRARAAQFCRASTFQEVNAAYCTVDQTIGWDRGVLLPELVRKFGAMSVVMVLAHEYGHSIQAQAKLNGFFTANVVREQQADCFAGVFLRYVAEGNSRHFTLNTTDGMNGVLGATIAVRDREPGASKDEHGSAFERVTAVQIGYTDGAQACKKITRKELASRRGTLPTSYTSPDEANEQLPVNRSSLDMIAQTLAANDPVRQQPIYDYTGVSKKCSNVTVTQPVSFCPTDSTIGVDVTTLASRARGSGDGSVLTAMVAGDYNAFIVFISRYMLALQQDRKLGLTGADSAGLRTACLSGAFSTKISQPGGNIRLSAGDLDEAVSGLLSDGLAASDVNGSVVPSGFIRLEAFRTGVLDGDSACLSTYK